MMPSSRTLFTCSASTSSNHSLGYLVRHLSLSHLCSHCPQIKVTSSRTLVPSSLCSSLLWKPCLLCSLSHFPVPQDPTGLVGYRDLHSRLSTITERTESTNSSSHSRSGRRLVAPIKSRAWSSHESLLSYGSVIGEPR